MKTTLIIILVVAFGVIGWVVLRNRSSSMDSANQPAQTNQPANNDFGSSQTITYNDVGFSPQLLTSKVGEKVTVENKSTGALQFSSDPYPTRTDNPQLNLSSVEAGGSITFTPTTIGNFGFHDQNKPDHTGRIVIQ
jgi:hypothetical protein